MVKTKTKQNPAVMHLLRISAIGSTHFKFLEQAGLLLLCNKPSARRLYPTNVHVQQNNLSCGLTIKKLTYTCVCLFAPRPNLKFALIPTVYVTYHKVFVEDAEVP